MLPTRTKGYMTSLLKSKSYKEFKDSNPDIGITKLGYNKLKNNSTNRKTGATRRPSIPNFTSGRQKKKSGGKVMKYKKGGIIYKQGGGVIKANSGGQNIVDSGYTKV